MSFPDFSVSPHIFAVVFTNFLVYSEKTSNNSMIFASPRKMADNKILSLTCFNKYKVLDKKLLKTFLYDIVADTFKDP